MRWGSVGVLAMLLAVMMASTAFSGCIGNNGGGGDDDDQPPPPPPPDSDVTHFLNGDCNLAGNGLQPDCAGEVGGVGPFNDISLALLSLTAGDVLQIANGSYAGRISITESDGHSAGTQNSPITVRGSGQTVLTGGIDNRTTIQIKRSFWQFETLRIVNDGESAESITAGQIKVRGPVSGIVLRDLDVDGQMRSITGISVGCIDGEGCPQNTLIENSIVYDQWLAEDGDAHCIYLDSAAAGDGRVYNTTIRNITSFGCDGDSVQIHQDKLAEMTPPDSTLIESCNFYRAYAQGREENAIDVKAGTNVTIRNNLLQGYRPTYTSPPGSAIVIHMGGGDTIIEGNRIVDSSYGIRIAHGSGASYPVNVTVRNNLILASTNEGQGEGTAIFVGEAVDVKIFHNTIVGCDGPCMNITGEASGVVIANNIVVASNSTEFQISAQLAGNQSLLVFHHNLLVDEQGERGRINGNPYEDAHCPDCIDLPPQFINPASDFHLAETSPAIDAGGDLGVVMDRDGCTRDATPDLGAYESNC